MKKRVKSNKAFFHYTQPEFNSGMDLWGEVKGEEVWESEARVSPLLGPDGSPLVHPKMRMGFDLSMKRR